MAPVVVALGPGFEAGRDVHAVVETNRGHDLGRVILRAAPRPNTGVPGLIADEDRRRVIYAPVDGNRGAASRHRRRRGGGRSRPLHRGRRGSSRPSAASSGASSDPASTARAGLKVADVDPRCVREHCFSVSDKARAVAGGVLEAILMLAP